MCNKPWLFPHSRLYTPVTPPPHRAPCARRLSCRIEGALPHPGVPQQSFLLQPRLPPAPGPGDLSLRLFGSLRRATRRCSETLLEKERSATGVTVRERPGAGPGGNTLPGWLERGEGPGGAVTSHGVCDPLGCQLERLLHFGDCSTAMSKIWVLWPLVSLLLPGRGPLPARPLGARGAGGRGTSSGGGGGMRARAAGLSGL